MTHTTLNRSPRPILFGLQSEKSIFVVDNSRFIPGWFIEWLQDHMDSFALQKARECEASTLKIARELVETKGEELAQGRGSKDIFSLIGKCSLHRMWAFLMGS